jgi:hypothetical protein
VEREEVCESGNERGSEYVNKRKFHGWIREEQGCGPE